MSPLLAAQTLRFYDELPSTLNPLYADDLADIRAQALVFERLFERSPLRSEIRSRLISRYERQGSGRALEITLQEGLTWGDGAPVIAEDVCFTLEAILEPQNPVPWAGLHREHVAGCEVVRPGPGGVARVHFTRAELYPREWLGVPLLPRHAFDSALVPPDHPFRERAFGTLGLVAQRTRHRVIYEASSGAEPPQIRRLELLELEDPDQMVQDLLRGRVHGIVDLPGELWPVLAPSDELALKSYDTRTLWYLELDLSHPWLADPRARAALDRLLDRQRLTESPRLTGPFLPSSPLNNRSVRPLPPSAAEGARLLADVGREHAGERLSLTVGGEEAAPLEALMEQLEEAGIEVTRAQGEPADLRVRSFSPDPTDWPSALLQRLPPSEALQQLTLAAQHAQTDQQWREAGHALHAWLAEERLVLFLWKGSHKSAWRNEVRHNPIGFEPYWTEFGHWTLIEI